MSEENAHVPTKKKKSMLSKVMFRSPCEKFPSHFQEKHELPKWA
jgi:hypothetical protein